MHKRLVLIFHGIGGRHAAAGADEESYWCSEARFLSILDAIPHVSAQMQIPIEITFDDGNASDETIAAPALHKRGLKATFFICAGRIGKRGYLDGPQLRSLAQGGMAIGSHGWDHLDWRRLTEKDTFEREVFQARTVIEDTVAAGAITAVAIPFGSYDRPVLAAVGQAFSQIYTSDGGLASGVGAAIPRECYTTAWDTDTLRTLASPRPWIHTLRRHLAVAYKRRRGPPQLAA